MTDKISVIKTFGGGVQFNRRESVSLEGFVALDEALILQIINGSILVHQVTKTDFIDVGQPLPGAVKDPDYFMSATGNDMDAGTSEGSPWKTLAKIEGSSFIPGDIIAFKAGDTFGDVAEFDFPDSGTEALPIRLTSYGSGAQPALDTQLNLTSISFITIENIKFGSASSGDSWCRTSEGSNITWQNCTFANAFTGTTDYDGIQIRNTGAIKIIDCTVDNTAAQWNGDCISIDQWSNFGVLIEGCDFGDVLNMHTPVGLFAKNVVLRNNYFRNESDRAFTCAGVETLTQIFPGENYVVEDNRIFDSDWDGVQVPPGVGGAGPGSNQICKFDVTRGIFRNNIIAGSEQANGDANLDLVSLSTFGSKAGGDLAFQHDYLRLYHNTFTSNPHHMISRMRDDYSAGAEKLVQADSVKWKNNILDCAGNDIGKAFRFGATDGESPRYDPDPGNDYDYSYNIITEDVIQDDTNGNKTTAQMATDYPASFGNNTTAAPTFVDFGAIATRKAANTRILYTELELDTGSEGKNAGTHLTTVSVTANSTTLTLTDARFFHDGLTMVEGDSITVEKAGGGTEVGVVTSGGLSGVSDTELIMDTAMDVTSGDKAFLTKLYNASGPDIGIRNPTWY